MKYITYLAAILMMSPLVSCFEDKGNYDYTLSEEYTVENVEETQTVLQKVENITLSPVVKDSKGNVISADDYDFDYKLGVRHNEDGETKLWIDLEDEAGELSALADYDAGSYKLWLQVMEKKTGKCIVAIEQQVNVTSSTYEGWLVLCNEGAENRARLDIVSKISSERTEFVYDYLKTGGLPEGTVNALGFGFYPNVFASTMDMMYLIAEDNSYLLDKNTLTTSEDNVISNLNYLNIYSTYRPVVYENVGGNANLIVSSDGDAYSQNLGSAGAVFTTPINVEKQGGQATYKVAPFIGCDKNRPFSAWYPYTIFYDTTNQRFMAYCLYVNDGNVLFPLVNPSSDMKYDFATGKDMVFMTGTAFNSGTIYAVLEDDSNKRYVYGLGVSTYMQIDQTYYSEIEAEGFDAATKFAFHSQYPYMYYVSGNNIYSYDLASKTSNLVLTVDAGETITNIKFNIFGNNIGFNELNDMSDEFLAMQYELIVCSYDSDNDVTGGHMRMYSVNSPANTLTLKREYDGFAKIADVMYRERRLNNN